MAVGLSGRVFPVCKSYDEGDVVHASLSWTGSGTNAPTITIAGGAKGDVLSSVSRSSTGVYAITLMSSCFEIIAAVPGVETSGTTLFTSMLKNVSGAGGTLTFLSFNSSGTLTDLTTTERGHVHLKMRGTSVQRRRA